MYIPGLNTPITYWPPSGTDSFGQPTFATPVALLGYWADKQENVTKPNKEEFVSRAEVSLNAEVRVGGYLFKGTSGASSPFGVAGASRIEMASVVPDLRSLTSLYRAYV